MNNEKKPTETSVLQTLVSIENLLKKKDDRPLSFREACTYLGFTRSYLYNLTHRKLIKFYKPSGKMLFFSKSELDDWIFCKSRTSAKSKANSNNFSAKFISNIEGEEEDDDD